MHARLRGLHRIELVVHRRGGASKVEDLFHFDVQRERHVVAHHLEQRMLEQVLDVLFRASEVVVDAQHVVAGCDQSFANMRTNEASAAGHENFIGHVALG